MTREQAVALYESKFWEPMTALARALLQLQEPRLCMPFDVFHQAVEEALGRSVWTHEFARGEQLLRELLGDRPAPTFGEIVGLIPEAKRLIVVVP
jgi:hypothetical protein